MSGHCKDCGAVAHYGRELDHSPSCPARVVGHKTIDTGEIDPETGFPKLRHEPLTSDGAEAILAACDAAKKHRAETMPDEKAALNAMFDAYTRLKELGWREAMYCPKDGTRFQVIEAGSTGVFDAHYDGEWPTGSYWVSDAGDLWPSRPVLFKLYPKEQAEYDAKMAVAGKKLRAILGKE